MPRTRFACRVRRLAMLAVAFAALSLAAASTALADASLQLQIDRDRIYLGESFMLYAKVTGDDATDATLDFSRLPSAEIERYAPQSSRSMMIINGKVTKDVSLTYPVAVKPQNAGEYSVGPILLSSKGTTKSVQGPTVTVVGIEEQDFVRVSVVPSGDTLLVDEPFTVTLTFSIAELPAPYDAIEPIHRGQPPHVDAGFLEQNHDVKGLKMPDITAILNRLVSRDAREPVFNINGYESREMGFGFGMFDMDNPFRARPIPFRIPPKHIDTPSGPRWEYSVTLDYIAKNEGDYTFGPVTFKGKVITGATEQREPVFADIFAVGPAATVRVVPPPEEGRPDWFIGSVGKSMQAHAELDTPVCKVGDPLTLEIRVTGQISLDNLRPPVLSLQPEITADFRVYEDDVSSTPIENGRIFKYRVRPLKAGTIEFPPIKLAYYDTGTMAYETILSDPIPVQAHATTQIASESFADTDPSAGDGAPADGGDASPESSSAITMSPVGTSTQSLLPPLSRLAPALVLPPAACLAAWVLGLLWSVRGRIASRFAKSGAQSRAMREIDSAIHDGTASGAEMAKRISASLRAFIGVKCGAEGKALSPGEAEALLAKHGCGRRIAGEASAILSALDDFAYRPGGADRAEVASMKPRIAAIAAAINGGRTHAANGGAARAIALLLLASASAALGDEAGRTFAWDRANTAMSQASSPEDFRVAARLYNGLVEDGARNAPLFANLGIALLQAGDGRNAETAFARAGRYAGSTPELEADIRRARTLANGGADAPTPWARTAFFWHYTLATQTRVQLALAAWCMAWLGALVRIATKKRRAVFSRGPSASLANALMVAGAIFALVFGTSAALTIVQERCEGPIAIAEAEDADAR